MKLFQFQIFGQCNIKFYNIVLRNRRRQYLSQYDILVSTTADGRLMTDEKYHKIINLPVKEFIAEKKRNPYWLKTTGGSSRDLLETRIQKQLNVAEKELKRKEEGLFLDQARIDVAAEVEIDLIRGVDGIEFDLYQIFEANFS